MDIAQELKTAMMAKNAPIVGVLRALKTKITNLEKVSGTEATQDEVFRCIKKESKEIEEQLEYTKDQAPLLEQHKYLKQFLPTMMAEEEVREIITEMVSYGAENIGNIMGVLSKNYKGKMDMKMANKIARELIF